MPSPFEVASGIDSGSKEYCGIDHKSQRNYDKKAGIEVLDICYERVDNQ